MEDSIGIVERVVNKQFGYLNLPIYYELSVSESLHAIVETKLCSSWHFVG